jgi:hypothetical protein
MGHVQLPFFCLQLFSQLDNYFMSMTPIFLHSACLLPNTLVPLMGPFGTIFVPEMRQVAVALLTNLAVVAVALATALPSLTSFFSLAQPRLVVFAPTPSESMARVSSSRPGDTTIKNGSECNGRAVRPFPSHVICGQRCCPRHCPPQSTTPSSTVDPAVAHIVRCPCPCLPPPPPPAFLLLLLLLLLPSTLPSPTLLVAHVVVCRRRHCRHSHCYRCHYCCCFLVDCCMWNLPSLLSCLSRCLMTSSSHHG